MYSPCIFVLGPPYRGYLHSTYCTLPATTATTYPRYVSTLTQVPRSLYCLRLLLNYSNFGGNLELLFFFHFPFFSPRLASYCSWCAYRLSELLVGYLRLIHSNVPSCEINSLNGCAASLKAYKVIAIAPTV